MPLVPGARIGPYEVIAPLGTGGMGEVFRARDMRLKRDVALKMLPEAFAADSDRVARFQREAEVLASLNHPNIAAIYSLETGGAATGIAMELVEGETLAERISRGRVPVDEVLRIGSQIASALDAAHERGIVHRDLKPANIKLTPNGDVKVLDFGLAKLGDSSGQPEAGGSNPTLAATMTSPAVITGVGVLLGTAPYMAPEQARGQAVDKRADIWAFGCIVYELLTGARAFRGESVADSLGAVLHHDPDWSALPDGLPAHIRTLLQRCLAKDRRQRLRDIGDVQWDRQSETVGVSSAGTWTGRWVAWGVAAALAGIAAVGWMRTSSGSMPVPSYALTVVPPTGFEFNTLVHVISPDGSAVIYYAIDRNVGSESGTGLYVRRLDSIEARRVPGSESPSGTGSVIWSPDSSSVVFLTPRGLVKVAVPDGPPQLISGPLGPDIVPRGMSWSDKGTILVTMPLMALPASGGTFTPIRVPGLKPGQIQSPEFLPGGDDLLFLLAPEDGSDPEVYLGTLRGDEIVDIKLLLRNNTAARYTPAGGDRVLFVRNDNLYAQRLNRSTRSLEGDAVVIVRPVGSIPGNTVYHAYFSVSRTGTIAWKPGTADLTQATMFNRRGEQVGTAGPASAVTSIVLSPDETRLLAFSAMTVLVFEVGQPGRVPIPRGVRWFTWSPDGARIFGMRQPHLPYAQPVIASEADQPSAFVDGPADGSSGVRTIVELEDPFLNPQDVSPDGTAVLGQDGDDVKILRVNKNQGVSVDHSLSSLVDESQNVFGPRFSPDGRWVVFEEATEGIPGALYVQPFPGPGRRRQVTLAGQMPEWRRDGKEIIFRIRDAVWSVPITDSGGDLNFGPAVRLFSGLRLPAGSTTASRGLAVSRDGSRIFVAQRVQQAEPNVIHVMTGAVH